jgi:hypothetical protein
VSSCQHLRNQIPQRIDVVVAMHFSEGKSEAVVEAAVLGAALNSEPCNWLHGFYPSKHASTQAFGVDLVPFPRGETQGELVKECSAWIEVIDAADAGQKLVRIERRLVALLRDVRKALPADCAEVDRATQRE